MDEHNGRHKRHAEDGTATVNIMLRKDNLLRAGARAPSRHDRLNIAETTRPRPLHP